MNLNNEIAYCDTSFILEYWQAYIGNEDDIVFQLEKVNRLPYFDYIKALLKTESRHENLKPLRRLINDYSIETNFISSFLALTELFEKNAEWNFKAIIAESTNIDRIFNKGKKEIGELISKVYKDKGGNRDVIFGALLPNHFEESIWGIEFKDLENFNLSCLDFFYKYSLFSVLQLGTTDILHLLAAKHLNAKYFITFDSDFYRIRDIIKEQLELTVIFTKDELNEFVRKLPPIPPIKKEV